jgi:hypothetical protein
MADNGIALSWFPFRLPQCHTDYLLLARATVAVQRTLVYAIQSLKIVIL